MKPIPPTRADAALEGAAAPAPIRSPIDAPAVLAELARWVAAGWLRRLDLALAQWLHDTLRADGAEAPPELLLCTALLAQREGRGHSCIRLAELLALAALPAAAAAEVDDWLDGPEPAQQALRELLRRLGGPAPLPMPSTLLARWEAVLTASAAVEVIVPGGLSSRSGFAGLLEPPRGAGRATGPDLGVLSSRSGFAGLLEPPRGAGRATGPDLGVLMRQHPAAPSFFAPAPGAGTGSARPLGRLSGATTPLVFEDGRLYLRRHWREERLVAAEVLQRVAPAAAAWTEPHPAEVRRWLDRLFGPPAEPGTQDHPAPPDWQRVAIAVALRGRLALITGGPGTGKTYTVARLLALAFALHPDPRELRIALAAPTGKAAARLKQSIDQALQALRAALPALLDWDLLTERLAQAHTLHKLLGARPDTRRLRHDARHPLEVDLLVVDEASMVHLELMAALLAALPARARLLLLGDKDQLASVEAGAVLGDLCADAQAGRWSAATAAWVAACTGQRLPAELLAAAGEAPALAQQTVMLRESRRFTGEIGALARAVNAGEAAQAIGLIAGRGAAVAHHGDPHPAQLLPLALQGRPGAEGGYGRYLQALRERPGAAEGAAAHRAWVLRTLRAFERFRLLCALREGEWGVAGLNRAIEQALRQRGWIARAQAGAGGPGSEWYEGRPVMVTRNDSALGVYNGDVGLALRALPAPGSRQAGALRLWLADGDELRSVLASRLAAVETAYAMTVHKSQGSEFEHTVLVLPPRPNPVLTRELVYTGITRARSAFTLVAPELAVLAQALQRRTRRASGLPQRLAGGAAGE